MSLAALTRGAAAGAAGAAALNVATYADMAVRGRSASSVPAQVVEKLLERSGAEVDLGRGNARDNRLEALGALSGLTTGIAVGAAGAWLRDKGVRLPAVIGIVLIGGAAMVASDWPTKALGIDDPVEWSSATWLSDALPHLVYGAVATAVIRGLER